MIIDKILFDILRLDEIVCLLQFKTKVAGVAKRNQEGLIVKEGESNLDFCYRALNETSRSFSLVIRELHQSLRDVICVYYLILRGLDTVEDDMEYSDLNKKVDILKNFHVLIENCDFCLNDFGSKSEKTLLENFPKLLKVYNSLEEKYKSVIKATCEEMGRGMAKFCQGEITAISTKEQYNEYTHYVAGILGKGLTEIFIASGLEKNINLQNTLKISNSMGLFLQKTNIIKDYLEDLNESRTWWPQEIWSKHTEKLCDFKENPNSLKSIECLNEMIYDALDLLPDVIDYLSRLKEPTIFRFCAIPQIMALSTLNAIYCNNEVFKRNIKMRKSYTAKIFVKIKSFEDFEKLVYENCQELLAKISNFSLTASKDAAAAAAAAISKIQSALRQLSIKNKKDESGSVSAFTVVEMIFAIFVVRWISGEE